MSKHWPKPKDPNDIADYTIDWSDGLDTGDVINGSTYSIVDTSPTLAIQTSAFSDTTTTVWLTGGTAGDAAKLLNRITTLGGRTFDQTVTLKIKDR